MKNSSEEYRCERKQRGVKSAALSVGGVCVSVNKWRKYLTRGKHWVKPSQGDCLGIGDVNLCAQLWTLLNVSIKLHCKCKVERNLKAKRDIFLRICRIWTKRYLITSQTRVKRVSWIHHQTIFTGYTIWCIRLTGWRPAIAFLYLFLFHSLLRLISFLSQKQKSIEREREEGNEIGKKGEWTKEDLNGKMNFTLGLGWWVTPDKIFNVFQVSSLPQARKSTASLKLSAKSPDNVIGLSLFTSYL